MEVGANEVQGKIVEILGPVVDAEFPPDGVPDILDALRIDREQGKDLILEVQQHLGERRVRAIAMDSTDGLQRGQAIVATNQPITVPIGRDPGAPVQRRGPADRRPSGAGRAGASRDPPGPARV